MFYPSSVCKQSSFRHVIHYAIGMIMALITTLNMGTGQNVTHATYTFYHFKTMHKHIHIYAYVWSFTSSMKLNYSLGWIDWLYWSSHNLSALTQISSILENWSTLQHLHMQRQHLILEWIYVYIGTCYWWQSKILTKTKNGCVSNSIVYAFHTQFVLYLCNENMHIWYGLLINSI